MDSFENSICAAEFLRIRLKTLCAYGNSMCSYENSICASENCVSFSENSMCASENSICASENVIWAIPQKVRQKVKNQNLKKMPLSRHHLIPKSLNFQNLKAKVR